MTDEPIIDEATRRSVRRWLNTHFELVSIVVMSLTAILTAWSGFQGARWTAIQTERYADATDAQAESVRASNSAEEATSIDLTVFIAWLDEQTDGDEAAAGFIYERFPERLRVATDAWLATDPFENPDAPPSPFAVEEYVVPAAIQAEELAVSAQEHTDSARGDRAGQRVRPDDRPVCHRPLLRFHLGQALRDRESMGPPEPRHHRPNSRISSPPRLPIGVTVGT